ncbi:MAG: amidohydrolase family protein, partial [Desulfatiglandales bacterium]|nr:amidohydrolase family protein [Desulfatiglandales bacterium]
MPDLILFNAHIIHTGPGTGRGRLVAVRAGKIMAVTGNEKLKELRGRDTKVIDCKGKTLVPGFIEAHFHLHAFAKTLVTLDLTRQNRVRSVCDIQAGIRKLSQTQPPKTWIRGKGYHEFDLAEKRHPNRWDLDQAAPTNPIKLTHRSGHAHVLNTPALELVGITRDTSDPTGGLIERDIETGEPTGLLYEMAGFLSKSIPPLDNQEMERGIKMANHQLLSLGITSVQDASFRNNLASWENFRRWKEHGMFKPRVSMMLGVECLKEYQGQDFSSHIDENQLRLNGTKIILDETTGQLHPPQLELEEMVLKIHGSGFQVAIHAIEEKAVVSACSAIAYALKRHPRPDHRHRIEHCSLASPTLSKRLASLGIMVVTQPPFIYYSGDRYLETVPGGHLKHL